MTISRREFLSYVGMMAGSGFMLETMTKMNVAHASAFSGPIDLQGDPKGASVVILGAGLAGLTSALELRKAGYKVKILEYQNRIGGRSWSIHGGDEFTELSGEKQTCQFAEGEYLNPGPWRIPYHHIGLLHYCRELGVKLEPFNQLNFNAYIHDTKSFGGKPQRYRHVFADFNGRLSELFAKATNQNKLGGLIDNDDVEILMDSLKTWGALDKNFAYKKNMLAATRRGYGKPPGGGLTPPPTPSSPMSLKELLNSGVWQNLLTGLQYEFQPTMFQPVGGMNMIAQGYVPHVKDVIELESKVTKIDQNEKGVTIDYEKRDGTKKQAKADYCICTIPLPILNETPISVDGKLKAAMAEVPYAPSVKVGLQFKRRFWEEDEQIFGGISFTDQLITQISYPSTEYLSKNKSVVLGAYNFGPNSVRFSSMTAKERIKEAVRQGAKIHPQYEKEFDNGFSVAWHRVPWLMGCYGIWTDERRKEFYDTMCKFSGRIVLAGEHVSYLPGWQEGAILSALDVSKRLHKRVMQS